MSGRTSTASTHLAPSFLQLNPLIDTNLAPIIFKNGSLYGLWRNDDDRGSLHVVYAEDWKKPETYVMIGEQSHPDRRVEDPFVWIDKNGKIVVATIVCCYRCSNTTSCCLLL
jgi:hypothetical protein